MGVSLQCKTEERWDVASAFLPLPHSLILLRELITEYIESFIG